MVQTCTVGSAGAKVTAQKHRIYPCANGVLHLRVIVLQHCGRIPADWPLHSLEYDPG